MFKTYSTFAALFIALWLVLPVYTDDETAGWYDKLVFCRHLEDQTPPSLCPGVCEPVCGVDGVTYLNECVAQELGVEVVYGGKC